MSKAQAVARNREMRVISFHAKNVYGIEERAIEPNGRAVLIRGRNASRKTSLIEAMLATIGGGSLATLARVGRNGKPLGEPEATMVLEGPGGLVRVEKKGGATAQVSRQVGDSAAFEAIPRPQEWLNHQFDPDCANPVNLLLAKEKDLALMMLEALPLEMDRDGLEAILATISDIWERPHVAAGLHPLEEIATLHKAIFTTRTGVNTNLDGKRKAADQTLRNAPAALPSDPKELIAKAEERLQALSATAAAEEQRARLAEESTLAEAQASHAQAVAAIAAEHKETARSKRAAHAAHAAELRAAVERQIAEESAAVEKEIAALRQANEERLSALDVSLQATRDEARRDRVAAEAGLAQHREALAAVREELADLRARAEAYAQARGLHEQAKQFSSEADSLKEAADRLTAALQAIDEFRRNLAKSLPVEGLEISGREVRVNGVPWSMVNHADRVRVAAKIAAARAAHNPLKVLFLDNLESLDSDNRNALIEYLVEHGIQPFGAQVTDGDQEVVYIGAVRAPQETVVA